MANQSRIGSQYPLLVVKGKSIGRFLDKTRKTVVPCYSRYGTLKIPPWSKDMSTEQLPKYCSPSRYWRRLHRNEIFSTHLSFVKDKWMTTSFPKRKHFCEFSKFFIAKNWRGSTLFIEELHLSWKWDIYNYHRPSRSEMLCFKRGQLSGLYNTWLCFVITII